MVPTGFQAEPGAYARGWMLVVLLRNTIAMYQSCCGARILLEQCTVAAPPWPPVARSAGRWVCSATDFQPTSLPCTAFTTRKIYKYDAHSMVRA